MAIGTRFSHNEKYLNGIIDELSIWDRAVSEEEIQNQFISSARNGSEDGIIAHYNFDEGDGNTISDIVGNVDEGAINGATWVNGAPLNPPTPIPGIINVPDQFASIQEAVDYAISGDTILVQPGTYFENIYVNKYLFLHSLAANGDTSFIEQTIIDAGSSGKPVFVDHESSGGEINGFTIQNGFGPESTPIPIDSGDILDVVYYPDQWPEENSYTIYDQSGNIIVNQTNIQPINNGPMSTYGIQACVSCSSPISLYASAILSLIHI